MTQIDPSQTLIQRIAALRQRVRMLLAAYGVGYLLLTLSAGTLVLAYADYLLHLQPGLRLLFLITGLIALTYLAFRKLVTPLSAKLSDRFLASRIENATGDHSDELTSAVEFIQADLPQRNALAARLVQAAQSHSSKIDFDKALSARSAGRLLAGGLIALIVAITIAALNPQLASIAWQRWSKPYAGTLWPRRTNVDFSWETTGGTKPEVWPQGEPIAIRARVDKAFRPGMRVWLHSSSDAQSSAAELMTFQSAPSTHTVGIYEKIVEPLGNQMLNLRLEAGDDTEKDGVSIRLAPRPEISDLQAQITLPSYVKNISNPLLPVPPVQYDLRTQASRAVEGSIITLRIHTTKPIGTVKGTDQPDISVLDPNKDAQLPIAGLSRKLIDPTTAELSFPATKSIQARIQVRDTDGFENHVGGAISLEVVPDALPSVTITEPRHQVERTVTGAIQLTINASDDLGLEDLFLRADNYDARAADSPQQPGSKFLTPIPWVSRTAEGGLATYTWDLSATKVKEGDRLSFYAMVRDNFAAPIGTPPNAQSELAADDSGKPMLRHKWVRSAPLTVQVLSAEQIQQDIQHNLQSVREQIKNLLEQQSETNAKTRAIQKAAQDAGVTTPDQKQQLAELASQQAQEAQRANAIENQVKQVAETIQGNKMDDTNLGKLTAEAQKGMDDVSQKDMPQAAADLSKAQDTAGKQEKDKAAAKQSAEQTAKNSQHAAQQQEQAMRTMDNLIKDLGATGDFEMVREKVATILKDQRDLNDRNRQAAAKALGQDPANLDPALKSELDKIAKDQNHLGDQTEKLTDQMKRTAEDLQKTDQPSAEAMKNASDASEKNQVSANQKDASKSIQQNQTSTAANQQGQATKGLEQMMDALDQQNRKQLENLALQLRALRDQIIAFIAKQEAIIADTKTAGEKATQELLTPVGDRQGRLQNNVLTTAAKAETLRDGRPIAMDLRDAAESMGTAAVGLLKGAQPDALPPEADALASLKAALKRIEDQLKKTEDQLKSEDLAELIKRYEAIQHRQEAVKTASDGIDQRTKQRGELMRLDGIALARQAQEQGNLIDEINKLSSLDKLKEYDVVLWVNSQIIDAMTAAKATMDKSQTGPLLASAQQTSIDRIIDIINALKEEKNKPNEFDKPSQNGGGGGGKPPLIPPLAQLKLLKAMQNVVNTGTQRLDKDINAAADPNQQNQLKQQTTKLGDNQSKIKDLADGIIKKMSGPGGGQ
jgi:hypothetical protein